MGYKYRWETTKNCIHSRCSQGQPYWKRGIKDNITKEELKFLWFRDKAYLMERPSIDRINPKGNYEINNCRYIELVENKRLGNIGKDYTKCHASRCKPIIQFSRKNRRLRCYRSIVVASKLLNIHAGSISECAKNKRKTAGGFVWKYEEEEK